MSINDLDRAFLKNEWLRGKNENMKILNITIFCMKVYCLYNTLTGDSPEFIYTSKVALCIDKECSRQSHHNNHYTYSPPFYVMYVTNVVLLIMHYNNLIKGAIILS